MKTTLGYGGMAALLALAGCTVYTRPEPVGVTEVTAAPVAVETYPHTVYDGRVVYWYDNHWYYQDRGRWNYYRVEPPALVRQRPYVQSAPPARHAEPYHHAPSSAPPARRVE